MNEADSSIHLIFPQFSKNLFKRSNGCCNLMWRPFQFLLNKSCISGVIIGWVKINEVHFVAISLTAKENSEKKIAKPVVWDWVMKSQWAALLLDDADIHVNGAQASMLGTSEVDIKSIYFHSQFLLRGVTQHNRLESSSQRRHSPL